MRLRPVLLLASLLAVSAAARADSITYAINAPLSDGGLFSGTFTYNTTDQFASTLVGATTNSSAAGTVNGSAEFSGSGPGYNFLSFFENTGLAINLVFPGSSGFSGVLCTTASTNCGGQASDIRGTINFLGTTTVTLVPTVTPVAATPEPSSFVLLGTGVLGLLGAARRRFA